MKIRERLHQRIEGLGERDLLWLEQQLEQLPKVHLSAKEKTELWKPLMGMLETPEAEAAFEEAIKCRPLTSRVLDLEP
jgi:hypothetical protein